MTKNVNGDHDELRQTLPESFNVYQGTVAMLSIFLGFVFSSLLSTLSAGQEINHMYIWILVLTMIALMTALMLFHLTLHQVFRYWRIFFQTVL